MAKRITDITKTSKKKETVILLTIKLEFKPYVEITGLEEFIDLGLSFYIIDGCTGSPISITPSVLLESLKVRKESAFFGLLNKKFNDIDKCITFASEVELRAKRAFEDKIIHFYRDWRDRSPST